MPHRILNVIDYLADHPSVGIMGMVKVFLIGNFEAITELGQLFQSLGYIFGGSLAGLTLFAYIGKWMILPLVKEINKMKRNGPNNDRENPNPTS